MKMALHGGGAPGGRGKRHLGLRCLALLPVACLAVPWMANAFVASRAEGGATGLPKFGELRAAVRPAGSSTAARTRGGEGAATAARMLPLAGLLALACAQRCRLSSGGRRSRTTGRVVTCRSAAQPIFPVVTEPLLGEAVAMSEVRSEPLISTGLQAEPVPQVAVPERSTVSLEILAAWSAEVTASVPVPVVLSPQAWSAAASQPAPRRRGAAAFCAGGARQARRSGRKQARAARAATRASRRSVGAQLLRPASDVPVVQELAFDPSRLPTKLQVGMQVQQQRAHTMSPREPKTTVAGGGSRSQSEILLTSRPYFVD